MTMKNLVASINSYVRNDLKFVDSANGVLHYSKKKIQPLLIKSS